jgi:hypothetical protein
MMTILKYYAMTGICWAFIFNVLSNELPSDSENKKAYESNLFQFSIFTIIFWLPVMVIIFIHLKDRK